MRFACIRNNTPTGHPWKAFPDRPNYLCEESEVDTLGTATWVSALQGELFPYAWLVDGVGMPPRPTLLQKIAHHARTRLRGRQSFTKLDELKRFEVVFVAQHAILQYDMGRLIREAKKITPETVFIGLPDNSLDQFRRMWSTEAGFLHYVSFARACDIHLTPNFGTEEYFQNVLSVPTYCLPTCYPFEYAQQYFRNRSQKEKVILIAGEPGRQDWVWSCAIARAIQRKHPDFLIRVATWSAGRRINPLPLSGASYEIMPAKNWREFLPEIARARILIDLDCIWTRGRLINDAAAVGTPSIGVNADMQRMLYADLVVEEIVGNVNALQLGVRLLEDADFYDRVQKEGYRRIEQLSYANSVKRLEDIVNKFRAGRMTSWQSWNPDRDADRIATQGPTVQQKSELILS